MAADFFLQKGFRNFAFYGYENVVWSEERCMGFRDRIIEKGFGDNFFEYQKQPLENLWYYESEPLASWIKSLPHPLALMACDDTQGNKIMEVCRVLGIKIPEEIAVLGVDNDEIICSLSDPPLSSVNLNIVKGGYEAAQLIERLMRDKEASCDADKLQIISSLSTPRTAISSGILIPNTRQTSIILFPCVSSQAINANGCGNDFIQLANGSDS